MRLKNLLKEGRSKVSLWHLFDTCALKETFYFYFMKRRHLPFQARITMSGSSSAHTAVRLPTNTSSPKSWLLLLWEAAPGELSHSS
uniref:Uncharacterized protein n=1 Tax=Oryzias sinensis TaxID=183150 RepID=A0A8C8DGF5_9TELE